MIATPQLEQIPFETLLFGAIGGALGFLGKVNAKLSVAVLVIANLANHILFQIAHRLIEPKLNISSEATYAATNAVVATITFIAAQQLNLISRRVAGSLMFLSGLIFMARLRVLTSS
jgi:hypothetical protein